MSWKIADDQMGGHVELSRIPERIISLVPSQTELLFDLGLENAVIGITKFCVHPEHWRSTKSIIGGTKKFHFEIIDQLQPDLIIGNKEENYYEGIISLRKKYPVWMSDIVHFRDALEMIRSVSTLVDKEVKGDEILEKIERAFDQTFFFPPLKTLYLMWKKPWMGAARGTFIDAMIKKSGLENVLSDRDRYPELSPDDIRSLNPSVVLLSTEPFPFSEKDIPFIREILPNAKILIVDGEMFSWYGSRLALVPDYFRSLRILN